MRRSSSAAGSPSDRGPGNALAAASIVSGVMCPYGLSDEKPKVATSRTVFSGAPSEIQSPNDAFPIPIGYCGLVAHCLQESPHRPNLIAGQGRGKKANPADISGQILFLVGFIFVVHGQLVQCPLAHL